MSGHGPIYEWDLYNLKTLKHGLHHMRILEKLGFEQDEELMASIATEIRSRRK